MKRITFILIALFCIALNASADRGGFVYKNFKVDAVVSASNEWTVTETIDVEFFEPRHGIYRYIPANFSLLQKLKQDDGSVKETTMTYHPEIKDIEVPNEEKDISDEGINKIIRIGSASSEVTGLHRYVIKYRFIYPSDRVKDKDYIFHTILGTDFAEEIENFSFNIRFEKPYLDYATSEWEVYGGHYGSTDQVADADIEYDEKGIYGTAKNIAPYNGLTLYLPLKEGYYENVKEVSPIPMHVCLILSILLVALIVWKLLTTKDTMVVKSIEFYPPDGISSAEVGTIIDGTVDDIDLASLIPWFASKGYLSIKEVEVNGLLGKKTRLEITKGNPLPGRAPEYQRTFYKILFSDKKKTVFLDELGEHPNAIEKTKEQLNGLYKGEEGKEDDHSLTHTAGGALFYPLLMITTTLAFWFANPVDAFDWGDLLMIGLGWTLPFFVAYVIMLSSARSKYMNKRWLEITFFILRLVIVVINFFAFVIFATEGDSMMSDYIFIGIFVVCFILNEFVGRFEISTPYRAEMMGKLLGLKEFIETAEKPRLEALLQDDPQYFYKILPYALVFDISDKWAKQFKDITMEQPTWYATSSGIYDSNIFTHSMVSNICSSTSNAITTISHDSSSASSSSGGGGFSGGGGGGGGGGSW